MIKITTSKAELEQEVDRIAATWRTRAKKRTRKFLQLGYFKEKTNIWGEVKTVFRKVQYEKCAYCERKFSSEEFGSSEYDLEHYRPKGRITAYPTSADGVNYNFSTGDTRDTGYYWLAYDLENYAAACKICNQGLKADRFPIEGTRGVATQNVTELNTAELPLLIFPLQDDPAEYIDFIGATPKAKFTQGREFRRALVTIDFFCLADSRREELNRERFEVIRELYLHYDIIQTSKSNSIKQLAKSIMTALCLEKSKHTACARAYTLLLEQDAMKAWQIYQEAAAYITAT